MTALLACSSPTKNADEGKDVSNLSTCKACKAPVAWDAKTCPQCGVRNPTPTPLYRRPFAVSFAIVFSLITYSCVSLFTTTSSEYDKKEAAKSPETKAAEKAASDKKRFGWARASAGAKALTAAAHDPGSIVWNSAFVVDKTSAVCYEYRAKNGFGAIRLFNAVLARDGVTIKAENEKGFPSLWNKECAGKLKGEEAVSIVR